MTRWSFFLLPAFSALLACAPDVQSLAPAPEPSEQTVVAPTAAPSAPSPIKPSPTVAAVPQPQSPPQPKRQVSVQQVPSGAASVLVLGDSQISFGAGAPYAAFFRTLGKTCANIPARFQTATAAAVGVRSTSLRQWTTTQETQRDALCAIDKRYGVNAGAYGVTSSGRTYIQIGQNPAYPYCPSGQPALPAAIKSRSADLVVLSFVGNAEARWQDPALARADWTAVEQQMPPGTACIAMTSIPGFNAETNEKRKRAQDNLGRAVTAGTRCAFVPGITPQTRRAFEGNKTYFRTDNAGKVTDPNHPTVASATAFTKLITPALCAAAAQVLNN